MPGWIMVRLWIISFTFLFTAHHVIATFIFGSLRECKRWRECLRPGSQYNSSAAFCFVLSPTVTDSGIELWSLSPSVTVDDDIYAALALYCELAFTFTLCFWTCHYWLWVHGRLAIFTIWGADDAQVQHGGMMVTELALLFFIEQ